MNEYSLEASKSAGNKQWVAVLTDTHPEYRFDRDFVIAQHTKRNRAQTTQVSDGTIVEEVWFSHSGNEKGRRYYRVDSDELVQLDGIADAERLLEERSQQEVLRRSIRQAVETLEEDDLREVAETINQATAAKLELPTESGQPADAS
ncbi:hypothetical protein [Halorubellus salinus]|uniref:hypothetical protein n=1 Tax=Halorubellus salinus TaxID=755309 RepID=UPI001D07E56E|nr:hypothetical protein [Halorubellus salinus]